MIRKNFAPTALIALGIAFGLAGCSSASSGGLAGEAGNPSVGGGGGSGNKAGGTGAKPGTGGGLSLGGATNSGGGGAGAGTCTPTENDSDHDGFAAPDDCNDCDPNANPGAYDVPGNSVDEDCNGTVDDAPSGCDASLSVIEDNDPMHAAFAIGLCQVSDGVKWGVVDVKYVMPDGSPGYGSPTPINDLSHGLMPDFGPAVHAQEGTRLLGLSSGTARRPSDAGYQSVGGFNSGSMGTAPPGFPIDSPSCSVQTANDPVAWNPVGVELTIKAPTNAKSFKYNFDFYTFEFPVYVCTQYNDFFVALQNPPPANALSGNISFDSQHNPVSVNNGFLEVCTPQSAGGKTFPCARGPNELSGTGFDSGHAATGWLETTSPVTPGQTFTLRFAIWDMGDPILDSTVLIDNFQFSVDEATGGSTTTPVPNPR
jgi:hypothetical protein